MNAVVKQRIKYLVEHGELYPTRDEAHVQYRRIWVAVGAIVLLQLATLVIAFAHLH